MGYKGLQGVIRGYRGVTGYWLQRVTGSYKRLQGVTKGYSWLQIVTTGYKRLEGILRSFKG